MSPRVGPGPSPIVRTSVGPTALRTVHWTLDGPRYVLYVRDGAAPSLDTCTGRSAPCVSSSTADDGAQGQPSTGRSYYKWRWCPSLSSSSLPHHRREIKGFTFSHVTSQSHLALNSASILSPLSPKSPSSSATSLYLSLPISHSLQS